MLYWQGAAGWEPETLPVFLRVVQPNTTVLDVGANTGLYSLLAARRSPSVRVAKLGPTRIDLIKIDTEGTEDAVLAGGAAMLSTDEPLIICEVLPAGNTAAALNDRMNASRLCGLSPRQGGPRRTERILGNATGACHDYLFVPRSRLEKTQNLLDVTSRS